MATKRAQAGLATAGRTTIGDEDLVIQLRAVSLAMPGCFNSVGCRLETACLQEDSAGAGVSYQRYATSQLHFLDCDVANILS